MIYKILKPDLSTIDITEDEYKENLLYQKYVFGCSSIMMLTDNKGKQIGYVLLLTTHIRHTPVVNILDHLNSISDFIPVANHINDEKRA